jgi:transcriptional regulator with XRE-family HTH domain
MSVFTDLKNSDGEPATRIATRIVVRCCPNVRIFLTKKQMALILPVMETRLNVAQISKAMQSLDVSRDELASRLGVVPFDLSLWLSGEATPSNSGLLKLSFVLDMAYEDMLVQTEPKPPEPVVAYRKVANKKTTEIHLETARVKGRLLRPLTGFMPNRLVRPAALRNPRVETEYIQQAVSDLRKDLGISSDASISYTNLIGKFKELGAVIIPVMWGERIKHGNALHIMQPDTQATWIYLNLDTNVCDFNFWMAHELAHVLSPDIAGTEVGENFADAFATALLFPAICAEKLYRMLIGKTNGSIVNSLKNAARKHLISPYTVYKAVNSYAKAKELPTLEHINIGGAAKIFEKEFPLVSQVIFGDEVPDAKSYVQELSVAFETAFFSIVSEYLHQSAQGPGWLAEVMEIPFLDAKELFDLLNTDIEQ